MQPFGKRTTRELIGRESPSKSNQSTTKIDEFQKDTFAERQKIIIDYVLQHATGDRRPYLKVSVLDYPLLGLLDSGASRTLVGKSGWAILDKLGLKLHKEETRCSVANGQTCVSLGYVSCPIKVMGKLQIIDVLVIPDIPHTLILGVDFWLTMGIVPDLRQDVWNFSEYNTVCDSDILYIQGEFTLTFEQRTALKNLIDDKLSRMTGTLGLTNATEHDIELLPDTKPIKQRYYPVSPLKQRIIDDELKKMLDAGVVEPCKSAWSSPICLVPKKDGTYRFCVDYRQLNAVTRKDAYPLPYISSILDQLRSARYLSSIDIKSAYWQVPLKETCRDYTAFTVPGRGLYRFRRMPFGLTNAPATFQRLVDNVLGADLQPSVLVYLDDIIIVSQDFESHLQTLGKVLDRLRDAGLTVSVDKCQFCRPSLKYLGFIVDQNGLRPDPEKVESILNLPRPNNVTEIRRFVGTASWYRRFIPNFSSILTPLSNLTRKHAKWNWTPECDAAFRKIKEHLVTAPILHCPDFTKTFILQTDASAYGIGAVLSQEHDDGERVVCYLSRSLTKQEQKYITTERECLAVIWSVEKLRHYLEGVQFVVITDHHSLLWLHNLKDPQGRLARWALRLQPYSFQMIHRKGKDHIVPDMLSRSVPLVETVTEYSVVADSFSDTGDKWYLNMKKKIQERPDRYPQWRISNEHLYKYARDHHIPEFTNEHENWKLVVPKDKRNEVLRHCHDDVTSGHAGVFKTYSRIRNQYYWPKLKYDVFNYVRVCKTCGAFKTERKLPAGLMGSRPKITQPWQLISLDFIGPFPRSSTGYTQVLVVTDYFSKYVLTFPVRSAKTASLIKCVEEGIFLVYGVPQYIMSDNGAVLRSREFVDLCRRYSTKPFYTALYYPRANHTERTNQTVKTMLSAYIKDSHKSWDKNLAAITCAIRTSKHETIGYSPYYVNFGREHKIRGSDFKEFAQQQDLKLDDEISNRQHGFRKMFADVERKIQRASERNRERYNLRRRPQNYDIGDKVWRRNKCLSDASRAFSASLAPKFVGPFIINKKTGTWTYELKDEDGILRGNWHVQDLKPYEVLKDDHG